MSFISCFKSVWNYFDFGSRAPQHSHQFGMGPYQAVAHPLDHVLVDILMNQPVIKFVVAAWVTAQRPMLWVFWIGPAVR